MGQIMDSEWMKDVPLPQGECESWSMLPTTSEDKVVSDIEQAARDRLATMGINTDMLAEHTAQSSRSPVISTYRIVIHRLQNNALLPPIAPPEKVPKSKTCILL